MFSKIDYKNQPKPIALTKGQSTYKKLEEMNNPPSDYNSIKKLIENNESNNQSKNIKLIPHKKK
jgi:hypothetical protein